MFITEVVSRETNLITAKVVGKMDAIRADIITDLDAVVRGE